MVALQILLTVFVVLCVIGGTTTKGVPALVKVGVTAAYAVLLLFVWHWWGV